MSGEQCLHSQSAETGTMSVEAGRAEFGDDFRAVCGL